MTMELDAIALGCVGEKFFASTRLDAIELD